MIDTSPVAIHEVASLEALAPRYDVVLCDVFGTLHDAGAAFGPAVGTLSHFRDSGGAVVLLSNSPLRSAALEDRLDRLGIGRNCFDAVVSSGDVTRAWLAAGEDRAVHHIGPLADRDLFEGLSIELVPADDATLVVCTGWPGGPTDPDPVGPRDDLRKAVARGLKLVCSNPDRSVEAAGTRLKFAGLIADDFAALGGQVISTGKPDPRMYEAALAVATAARGGAMATARVLAIGDLQDIDVAGAHLFGIDALWIAGKDADSVPAPAWQQPSGASIFRMEELRW